jgi:hypothetical protein
MTRKSRVSYRVEALEPKILLSAVRAAGLAPVLAHPLTVSPPDATVPTTTTLASATGISATTGDPTAPVVNALDGSYVRVGRSLSVSAVGSVASLGHVDVNGLVTVSGPMSAQNVTGMVTLTGSEGSVTIQLQASRARRVIGNKNGPVAVTETVIGATGDGISVQGESARGFLGLGSLVVTKHGKRGVTSAPRGSFWLVVGLNRPAG